MSNFNREWFPGFGQQILIGAEDVNGTGEVMITFSSDECDEPVTVVMDIDQADELARFVQRKSDQARAARMER